MRSSAARFGIILNIQVGFHPPAQRFQKEQDSKVRIFFFTASPSSLRNVFLCIPSSLLPSVLSPPPLPRRQIIYNHAPSNELRAGQGRARVTMSDRERPSEPFASPTDRTHGAQRSDLRTHDENCSRKRYRNDRFDIVSLWIFVTCRGEGVWAVCYGQEICLQGF